MALNQNQIELVQTTFRQIAPISDTAAEIFYDRLFELDPSLRSLFHHDMKDQGRKLMQMVSVAVHGLNHLDRVAPAVEDLGRRHTGYGVKPEDYQTVGEALLWALEQGLGEDFTDETRVAWTEVYRLLAETALRAA